MQSKQLSANEWLLVFTYPEQGELIQALNDFAQAQQIPSGRLTAVGSIESATLGWWNAETKIVEKYTPSGQFEVVSFIGNITSNASGPRVHAHAVLAGQGGLLVGGHCIAATVRASMEVSITVFDTPVQRVLNNDFNLWTIDLEC